MDLSNKSRPTLMCCSVPSETTSLIGGHLSPSECLVRPQSVNKSSRTTGLQTDTHTHKTEEQLDGEDTNTQDAGKEDEEEALEAESRQIDTCVSLLLVSVSL